MVDFYLLTVLDYICCVCPSFKTFRGREQSQSSDMTFFFKLLINSTFAINILCLLSFREFFVVHAYCYFSRDFAMQSNHLSKLPRLSKDSVDISAEPNPPQRPRRRRRLKTNDKMLPEANQENACNGSAGERRRGSKIEIRLISDNYKPLINSPSSDTVNPCSDQDELEMTNLEDERLLLNVVDGETEETPSPECSVSINEEEETACTIAWQVAIPFLIAGLGMVGAGLVLDIVQVCTFFC